MPLAKVEGFFLTATQIQAEIDLIGAAILALEEQIAKRKGVSSISTGGRQIVFSESLDLIRLYQLRDMLEAKLVRAERGGGIPVRYGVIRG